MIFDHHQGSGIKVLVYTAAGVSEYHFLYTETLHDPYRKCDLFLTVTLIIMNTSLHGDDTAAFAHADDKLSGMTCYSRNRKARKITVGNGYRIFNLVSVIPQAAP